MANEASIINNPDNIPGAASSGYQAQNTRFIAQANGLDCSVVKGGVGQCTVKISGPVDVNDVLYSIASDAVLTPALGVGNYLIYLDGAGNNLTPTLTMTPGDFDETKNAHYTAGGKRILNWLVKYDGTNCRAYKLGRDLFEDVLVANGTWVAPFSKVYEIWVTGKGGDGGDTNSVYDQSAGGGGAGATGKQRIFIEAGTVWTGTFSALEAGSTSFTDGITTLSVGNGNNGSAASSVGLGGAVETSSLGMDIVFSGGCGANGHSSYPYGVDINIVFGGLGGASFYGQGGRGGKVAETTIYNATNGSAYGSGGGGSCENLVAAAYYKATKGTGASGIIRIIG
jgi:hypothetical protein